MTTLKPDALEEVSWLLGTVSQQPSPFHLSQIFLKLEEESERRAIEAEEVAPSPNIPDLAIAAQRAAQRRQRSKGSVSVSRFGHVRSHDRPSHRAPYDSSYAKDRGRYTTTKFKPIANVTTRLCTRHDDILCGQSHMFVSGYACLDWRLTGLCRVESKLGFVERCVILWG